MTSPDDLSPTEPTHSGKLHVVDQKTGEKALVADFTNGEFPTIQNFPHPTQRTVLPIVAVYGNELRPVGTGFAVTNHGVIITARHVIEECLSPAREQDRRDGPWSVAALYVASPEPGDDVPDLLGGILMANKIHFGDTLDLAAIYLSLPVRVDTNEPLRMPAMRLSPGIPKVGERCFGFGYHSMTYKEATDGKHTHEVHQSYSASRGTIEEIHFPSRDSAVVRFPAFRTTARFDTGMSGGPVLGESGDVIGAVCSSIVDDQGYISYVSLIGPALFLQIDVLTQSGSIEPRFLYDFHIGGSIQLNNADAVKILAHSPTELTIDFGRPPILRQQIDVNAEAKGLALLEGKAKL